MSDTLKALKDELAETCQKAFRRGLVGGAGGNISVRVPGEDRALITATGISLGDIGPETIVLVDLQGKLLEGAPGMRPSKETGFHVCAYRMRPQVGAVVHLHPPHATAFAVRGMELPLVTDGAMLSLKHVPVVGTPLPARPSCTASWRRACGRTPTRKRSCWKSTACSAWAPT